ncbi:MAG TPA: helix-turn-helix domain-containing protein [Propionibacteriaceae bacterium]|jgi:hypothetical protein
MREHEQAQRQPETNDSQDEELYYSIDQVAKRLKVSPRWLADQCREGLVEHVHLARKRKFTPEQVQLLLAKHTVRPVDVEERNRALERQIRRVREERSRGRR